MKKDKIDLTDKENYEGLGGGFLAMFYCYNNPNKEIKLSYKGIKFYFRFTVSLPIIGWQYSNGKKWFTIDKNPFSFHDIANFRNICLDRDEPNFVLDN